MPNRLSAQGAATSTPARSSTAGRHTTGLSVGFAGSCSSLLVSQGERKEAELEWRLRTLPGVTRPNTVALISPKGGVGKTTSTFLVGNLLASHLKLRAIAVDANPDFGTLARLAPDERRCERSLADLLDDAERLNTAAELRSYVSRMPTGLHVLGAPRDAELTASLGPDRYGELVAFLSPSTRSCCSISAPASPARSPASRSSAPTRSCSSRRPSG